jgi:hypothetical protein
MIIFVFIKSRMRHVKLAEARLSGPSIIRVVLKVVLFVISVLIPLVTGS